MLNYKLNKEHFKLLLNSSVEEKNDIKTSLLSKIIEKIDASMDLSNKYSIMLALKEKGQATQQDLDDIDSEYCKYHLILDDLNHELNQLL